MGKCDKLYEAAVSNPQGLRFADLCHLAECLGCTLARSAGSHVIYTHPKLLRPLSFQRAKNGMAKKYQVRQLLDAIAEISGEE